MLSPWLRWQRNRSRCATLITAPGCATCLSSTYVLGGAACQLRLTSYKTQAYPWLPKSDHTRSRTWVVAATTRRPNHYVDDMVTCCLGDVQVYVVQHERTHNTSEPPSSPDGPAGQSSPFRLRSHQTSVARPDLEHLMRGLPCGVLASRLPPPRRDRQRSA